MKSEINWKYSTDKFKERDWLKEELVKKETVMFMKIPRTFGLTKLTDCITGSNSSQDWQGEYEFFP